MSVSFLVFFILLKKLSRLRICAFNFLLIYDFLIFFPLIIFAGMYLVMRSDTEELNLHLNSCVVETGSNEIKVSFMRLSSASIDEKSALLFCSFVCLFDLILYVPSTIFQLYRSSWVEPVLS